MSLSPVLHPHVFDVDVFKQKRDLFIPFFIPSICHLPQVNLFILATLCWAFLIAPSCSETDLVISAALAWSVFCCCFGLIFAYLYFRSLCGNFLVFLYFYFPSLFLVMSGWLSTSCTCSGFWVVSLFSRFLSIDSLSCCFIPWHHSSVCDFFFLTVINCWYLFSNQAPSLLPASHPHCMLEVLFPLSMDCTSYVYFSSSASGSCFFHVRILSFICNCPSFFNETVTGLVTFLYIYICNFFKSHLSFLSLQIPLCGQYCLSRYMSTSQICTLRQWSLNYYNLLGN